MKRIITVLLLSLVSTAYALPNCPSELTARWHNCFGSASDNGKKYVGEWKDDKQHGQGTHTWAGGEKYVGEWKDGKRHGQGTNTWADGDKYVGEWKDGEKHGQGTYTFVGGAKYVGEFKGGEKHGLGTYTFANGKTDKGYYMNDDFIPDICKGMGLAERTETFGNCVVKLIDKL